MVEPSMPPAPNPAYDSYVSPGDVAPLGHRFGAFFVELDAESLTYVEADEKITVVRRAVEEGWRARSIDDRRELILPSRKERQQERAIEMRDFARKAGIKRFVLLLGVTILLVGFAVGKGGTSAFAGSKTATISFGIIESSARADNGDTVEVNGAGTFTLQPKSVSGDGGAVEDAFGATPRTFTHRNADGDVLAQGTWEPTAVLSYRSFGPATPEQDAELGGLPPGSEGGKVMIKVALFVGGVHVHEAIITIVCSLGVPPKNAVESTLLKVLDTDLNFHETISGDNIFIRE